MGNETSLLLETRSNPDADEIRRLGKRLRKPDLANSAAPSVDESMSPPKPQQNPPVQRVIGTLDADRNGEADFKESTQGAPQSSVKGAENNGRKNKQLQQIDKTIAFADKNDELDANADEAPSEGSHDSEDASAVGDEE